MKEIIENYLLVIKNNCPDLSANDLAFLASELDVISLKPKDIYIHEGELQQGMGFVHAGLMRSYYINEKGKNITINFAWEGKHVSHYIALKNNTPSRYFFEAIEPTILVNIPRTHIINYLDKIPYMEHFMLINLDDMYDFMVKRLESFLISDAETRYLDFVKEYPDLFNRIPISLLCSYLGIERQSLTRIRTRLAKK